MLCETEQLVVFIEYHRRTNGATAVDNNLVDKVVDFHSSHWRRLPQVDHVLTTLSQIDLVIFKWRFFFVVNFLLHFHISLSQIRWQYFDISPQTILFDNSGAMTTEVSYIELDELKDIGTRKSRPDVSIHGYPWCPLASV
jgi:hypothetical protein